MDDRAAAIAGFILQHAAKGVEFELRLGTLKQGGVRYELPIQSEAVLDPVHKLSFVAGVPDHCSAEIHRVLRANVDARQMTSVQTTELDFLYDGNLRFTRETSVVPPRGRVIRKHHLASLDFYSPQNVLDFRLSASLEANEVKEAIPTTRPIETRGKERISYAAAGPWNGNAAWRFDVTAVSVWSEPGGGVRGGGGGGSHGYLSLSADALLPGATMNEKSTVYEVEIECLAEPMLAASDAARAGEPAALVQLANDALTNVRFLLGVCTAAPEASTPPPRAW